jgi:coenzyme Q-binding protein COQ10
MPGATRSIVIAAPPEKAFDVITDYDRYAEFLP